MSATDLRGQIDLLLLSVLVAEPAHGYRVIERLRERSEGEFDLTEGTVYPALHRLERRAWVTSKWEMAADRNREFKYYRLTDKGRKQLVVEESQWKQMADAVARVMWPADQES